MPIQVKCPNADCAKAIRVHDELAGKAVRCPACKTTIRLPSLVTTAGAPAATKPAAPLAPAPKPAPSPEKTSPKPPPPEEEEVPTLDGFDDLPPAKGKITSKPAPVAKKDEFDDFDEFTDEAPKKLSKPKKDELDLPKKAKGKWTTSRTNHLEGGARRRQRATTRTTTRQRRKVKPRNATRILTICPIRSGKTATYSATNASVLHAPAGQSHALATNEYPRNPRLP